MGSGWGWDVLDFFLFLLLTLHSFSAFSWEQLHNKSLPFTPLALGWLLWEPDLDRWPNVRTCHSHRQDLCYRHGRSRQASQQAWQLTWSLNQCGMLKWKLFRKRWEDQSPRWALWTVPLNSNWNRWHRPCIPSRSIFLHSPIICLRVTCLGHCCKMPCPYLSRYNLCLYLGLLQRPQFGTMGVLRCSTFKFSSFPQGLYSLTLALRVSDNLRVTCEIFNSVFYYMR